MPTRRAARRATSSRRSRSGRSWPTATGARLRQAAHRARRAHGGFRRRHGLSPPHGHDRRDRRGGRPADGGDRRGGRPPLRHAAIAIFSGGDPVALLRAPCRPRRACPLQGRPPPMSLERARARDESFMQAVLDGVFTVPGDGFDRFPDDLLDPARRRLFRLARGRRPSRIRPRRIPSPTPAWASAISPRFALKAGFSVEP